MSDRNVSLLASLRREEYTGENRCLPCTVVNVGIAAVLAIVAGFVAVELAVVVFVGALVSIYLRGYLVPGTPTLTKRYLPNRILALFDKHPNEEPEEKEWETLQKLEEYEEQSVEPEQFLRDIGAIESCDRVTEVCYADSFGKQIRTQLAGLAVDNESVAIDGGTEVAGERFTVDADTLGVMYDVDPETISAEDRDYPAVTIGRRIRKWPSEESFALDVATHLALEAQSPRWQEVPQKQRVEILRELRALAEHCPGCDGPITTSDAVVESCCAEYEVVSIGCRDCGAHLLERDPERVDDEAGGFNP